MAPGKGQVLPSPTCTTRGGSSPPSASIACSNSPAAAAAVNLAGMLGMVPLRGANWGEEGPGRQVAAACAARELCMAAMACAEAASGW